jgi:hypothetical protein
MLLLSANATLCNKPITGCGVLPGIYTNVGNYDTFIKQSICALLDSNDRPSYCGTVDFCNIRIRTDCCGAGCVGTLPTGICNGDPPVDEDSDGCAGFLECVFELFSLLCALLCGVF